MGLECNVLKDSYKKCMVYGASLVASQIKDTSIIVHGPKGCVFPAILGANHTNTICLFSEICEKHIIFGGEAKLKSTIEECYNTNNSETIFVITTCSTEIIGDYIEGVFKQIHLPINLIELCGAGFKGDSLYGINSALLTLCQKYCCNNKKVPNFVNFVGNIGETFTWESDYRSLGKMLEDIGLIVNYLGYDNTLDDYIQAGKASLTVLTHPEIGIDMAKYLESCMGVPFIANAIPVGVANSTEWLKSVAENLNIEVQEKISNMEDATRRIIKEGIDRSGFFTCYERIKNNRAAIVADCIYAKYFAFFLVNELEVNLHKVITKDKEMDEKSIRELVYVKSDIEIIFAENVEDVSDSLENGIDIVYGDEIDFMICKKLGIKDYVNIGGQIFDKVNIINHAYLGYEGSLYLVENILNCNTL